MSEVILVTGGAGFIGSHLSQQLVENGDKVICIDNVTTGRKKNIQALVSNKNFEFIKSDISSQSLINKLKKISFDKIYHLASPASVTYVTKYPVESAMPNVFGTQQLLEFAKKKRVRFLFASSSEVYGDPKEHPQKETYWGNSNPVGIRSGYDEGKRFGEALAMAYHREFGVSVGIARIFNTYGPHFNPEDTRVIPQLIMQAVDNKPLTVHGNGSQTRSFCYVSDTVEGLIRLMNSNETGPFNIGNPDEYTITDTAKIVLALTKSKSSISYTARPQDDPHVRKPDISLAQKKLHWKPKVSFRQGLLRTVDYYLHEKSS